MIGKKIAHYEITERIGAGGMGEVFRAKDMKLGRDVALKLLPEHFALDADRLSRFDREAKLLAALNHANIAAIYGVEESDGQRLLVLELVEGQDLQERLQQGALPVDDALPAALQICEALEAAHHQGVVHRDLKPANVKVTPDGTVKVLDFGLAKALDTKDGASDLSHSPTLLASSPTIAGVIIGTAAFMSPEQARGKAVDRRADIFAFGAVLYQMLAGKQCFTGETVSDTLAAVLKTEPDYEALPKDTPGAIVTLLKRCLDKNPRQRLQDIGEARITIDQVIRGEVADTVAEVAAPAKSRTFERIGAAILAVILAAGAFFVAKTMQPGAPDAPLKKFRIPVSKEGDSRSSTPSEPVISPSGSHMVYCTGDELVIQPFDKLDVIRVAAPGRRDAPWWSPDGQWIGYVASGRIWKVPVTGGTSVLVVDPGLSFAGGGGGTWTEDGRILFTTGNTGIMQVSENGGDESVYLELAESDSDHHEVFALPDGRGVLYAPHRTTTTHDRIEVAADGVRTVIVEHTGARIDNPRYSATGHVLYQRHGPNGGLWAVPFSLEALAATGDPFIVSADGRHGSAASDGTLIYLEGGGGGDNVLRWLSRDGTLSDPLSDENRGFTNPSFSPDGKKVAVTEFGDEETDIWIYDLERGANSRFTFESGSDLFPAWSPDGSTIYYWNVTADTIWAKPADGTGTRRPVVSGRAPSVSPDHRYLSFSVGAQDGAIDIYYTALDTINPKPIVVSPARKITSRISPQGSLLGYVSNESGSNEVFLTRFPGGDGKWQVSVGGARTYAWSASGDAIHYSDQDGNIHEVTVTSEPRVELSRPQEIFNANALNLANWPLAYYKQSPNDPDQFLVMSPTTLDRKELSVSITVVQNWFKEFENRAK
jgi:serine/threonine-protein kinase